MVETVNMTDDKELETTSNSSPKKPVGSRISGERENLSREAVLSAIENDDWLHIPDSIKEKYIGEGYVLRWLRVLIDGQEDYQNLGLKEREGWALVPATECPELSSGFRVMDDGRMAGCILRGDVALGKQPIEYADAKRKKVAEKTKQMEDSIKHRLMSDHPDRRVPVTDSSKSRTSMGKNAHFDA